MSVVLTVPSAARDEPRLRLGIATLPTSFRYVDGPADVVGLVGAEGWVAKAVTAIESGAHGVLVVDPTIEEIEPLQTAASEHGAAIILDRGWASSPSIALAAPEFAQLAAPTALIEARLHAPTGDAAVDALMRQAALLRAAIGEISTLRIIRVDATGYDALGTMAGGADVALSAVFSTVLGEAAMLRIIRRESSVVLELGPIDIASPASLRILSGAGENHVLTPWETPHREAWRRLARAVDEGSVVDELDAFARDASLVRAALESAPRRRAATT